MLRVDCNRNGNSRFLFTNEVRLEVQYGNEHRLFRVRVGTGGFFDKRYGNLENN